MKLRNLKQSDAKRMLEWMHDENIVEYMAVKFMQKTMEDCKEFIAGTLNDDKNFNMAVTDDNDIYMGTVSLKHIDRATQTAEFAIVMHADALGRGYARYGMGEIMRIGMNQMEINEIYWCVSNKNVRAINFYDKNGCKRTEFVPEFIKKRYSAKEFENIIWYAAVKT